jgi:hypothetical protein
VWTRRRTMAKRGWPTRDCTLRAARSEDARRDLPGSQLREASPASPQLVSALDSLDRPTEQRLLGQLEDGHRVLVSPPFRYQVLKPLGEPGHGYRDFTNVLVGTCLE